MKFIQRKVQHCSNSSPFVIKECLKGRIEISSLFAVADVLSNALTTAGIDETTTTRWTRKIFNFPKHVTGIFPSSVRGNVALYIKSRIGHSRTKSDLPARFQFRIRNHMQCCNVHPYIRLALRA
jgi:hypothetical protein